MLNDKDRELISIGASIAANCQPCAKFHLRAAQIAGATQVEINQAVDDAQSVSRHAAERMAEMAAQYVGASVPDQVHPDNPLMSELVSISAACAINSTSDLDHHLAAAQKLGATKGQILSAFKIAHAIKSTAQSKADEATVCVLGAMPGTSGNCCSGSVEKIIKPAGQPRTEERSRAQDCGPDCSCHSDIKRKSD